MKLEPLVTAKYKRPHTHIRHELVLLNLDTMLQEIITRTAHVSLSKIYECSRTFSTSPPATLMAKGPLPIFLPLEYGTGAQTIPWPPLHFQRLRRCHLCRLPTRGPAYRAAPPSDQHGFRSNALRKMGRSNPTSPCLAKSHDAGLYGVHEKLEGDEIRINVKTISRVPFR